MNNNHTEKEGKGYFRVPVKLVTLIIFMAIVAIVNFMYFAFVIEGETTVGEARPGVFMTLGASAGVMFIMWIFSCFSSSDSNIRR